MNCAAVLYSEVSKEAPADEQDTLVQVEAVCEALRALGFEPVPVTFTLNLEAVGRSLRSIHPRLVFNLVESVNGQGRLVYLAPALLDSLQLAYTGAGTEAMFLTSNKQVAKRLLMGQGLSTPPAYPPAGARETGFEPGLYIVKSVWEHASIGLDQRSIVSAEQPGVLKAELAERAARWGGDWFAEKYIDGREFNLSLLAASGGPQVLPPAEIRFDRLAQGKHRIVDYRAKWDVDSEEYRQTPRCFDFSEKDRPLLDTLRRMTQDCWKLFRLGGYARVDLRVDTADNPFILEVNANPCLSPDGGFAAAARRAGISFASVVARIIDDIPIG